jgi:hypothetical protein
VDIPALKDAQQRATKLGAPARVTGSNAIIHIRMVEQLRGNCLDLYNNQGPYIFHWPCNQADNQRWLFVSTGSHWEIRPYQFQQECADVENVVGPNILKFTCQSSAHQRWEWWTDGNVNWFSPSSNRNTCLDSELHGTHALAWPCNGAPNQHWILYVV